MTHGSRTLLLALAVGFPGTLIAVSLLWFGDYSAKVQWTLTVVGVGFWVGTALALRNHITRPLQALSNLLAALREGDYSLQSHGGDNEDPMGQVMHEINALTDVLRSQRMGAIEAFICLRSIRNIFVYCIFVNKIINHIGFFAGALFIQTISDFRKFFKNTAKCSRFFRSMR